MIKPSNELVKKLRELLGMPGNTRSFKIEWAVDRMLTVECEYMPQYKHDQDVARGLKTEAEVRFENAALRLNSEEGRAIRLEEKIKKWAHRLQDGGHDDETSTAGSVFLEMMKELKTTTPCPHCREDLPLSPGDVHYCRLGKIHEGQA